MSGINIPASKLEFQLMSSVIDFCDLVYFTLPRSGVAQNGSGDIIPPEKIRKIISNISCICSSERAESFANKVRALSCSIPKTALYGLSSSRLPNTPLIIENGTDDALVNLICQASKASEYKNTVFYSTVYGDDNFIGVFILLSDYQDVSLKLKLEQPWVIPHLDLLNFFYPRASASISRAICSSCDIPSKTLDVLRMSSQGARSKDIGEKLHLTTRGVEYHLEKAKNILNVSNKVQLISVAKDSCLI